ncbi:Crp/Fnr family transcriptional regulator [Wenzhouxiangella sp. XN24]|uniref:Crp/Fnr family transcriptional regulator n=1 Tax=Wenzhouxiangella sp. XN24 TaxID=2713569 RepID=UPI0013ECFDD3|nr:Crp/Fnr family transcriptional regulator [Wenzhouxiangella sp. XN24]NGX15463.1 Crp/Fnr family transcriptional regulator [Wenzhouxiangella sp. XN24]
MTSKPESYGNHLLDLLPRSVSGRLSAETEIVQLVTGTVLRAPGQVARHVYFPLNCTISLLNLTQDGSTTEVAAIGNEGLLGVPVILGGGSAVNQAAVTMAGQARRVDSALFAAELENCTKTRAIMLRYVQILLTQVAQNAVCLRRHGIEQRLARCLLHANDRALSETLLVTHDLLSNALGVRREAVTHAVHRLHEAGLIENHRARIQVLERERLAANACECYDAVQAEYQRLLGPD